MALHLRIVNGTRIIQLVQDFLAICIIYAKYFIDTMKSLRIAQRRIFRLFLNVALFNVR